VSFLRKLFGGGDEAASDTPTDAARPAGLDERADDRGRASASVERTPDEEERAHELELARFEQARTDDLIRRQQRFADRSWRPDPQGGPARSDDAGPAEA
jgi:hypothetical protein